MEKENIIGGPKFLDDYTNESFGLMLYNILLRFRNLPTALTDAVSGRTLSYADILRKTCLLAESLQKMEIKQNDVVAIFSENNLEYVYPLVAALYLGCVVTMFSPEYTTGEFCHVADISKPNIIFCSEKTLGLLTGVKEQIKSLKKIILLDAVSKHNNCEGLEDFIDYSNVHCDQDNFKVTEVDAREQVAFILYSSGTTGLPKGVMLTHRNMSAFFARTRNEVCSADYKPATEVIAGFLPFFHGFGLFVILWSLLSGNHLIVLKSFVPEVFLKTIQDYQVSIMHLVPPLVNFLAKSPLVDNYDLSRVTTIVCGAAPLRKETQEMLLKRLNPKVFVQGYGLTETSVRALEFRSGEHRPGSCGRVAPNISAKVIDVQTGKTLGPRQTGELCFKGDIIMKGYVGDIEAIRKTIDEEGWLHTGDLGFYDEDGFFYIVDRIKELIKYKAFQVPPAELEAVLLTHPKILDAGVVGLPDEIAGELPVAFVVTKPDETVTEKEVQNFVAKRVSPQKRLRGGIRFVEEIPKTPSGKILRKVLREQLANKKSKL